MVSYEKACKDILRYFNVSTKIVVIEPNRFRILMLLLKAPTQTQVTFAAYSVVDIQSLIPHLIDKMSNSQNHWEPGLTALITEYAQAWIPHGSPDYTAVINQTFLERSNMDTWQRGIRASISTDRIELTNLSLDPDSHVREIAQKRLKEFEL